MFSPKTWWTKKPFGYCVAHHGFLLTSCPGQNANLIKISFTNLQKLLSNYNYKNDSRFNPINV